MTATGLAQTIALAVLVWLVVQFLLNLLDDDGADQAPRDDTWRLDAGDLGGPTGRRQDDDDAQR